MTVQAGDGIVDAHHHLWDLREGPQSWIDPTRMSAIQRSFWLDELAAAVDGTGVDRTVVVQSIHDDGDVERLLAGSAASPLVAAVVGWADLTSDRLADRLAELRESPGGGQLAGLRHVTEAEADP